jgi:hypothetical protein
VHANERRGILHAPLEAGHQGASPFFRVDKSPNAMSR